MKSRPSNERIAMRIILIALLIVLILGALGFAAHILWWIAIAALIIWLLGFVLRVGETIARPRRRRWYNW
jgi:membrane protein YdbS with pleckstrin-like domain